MVLVISEDEVLSLVSMRDAIEAVEEITRLQGLGRAYLIPRKRVYTGSSILHIMAAASEDHGVSGLKAYISTKDKTNFVVLLFDNSLGELLAIIEADALGRLRTGAASAVATKYLAKKSSEILGIIGSGKQARTQALGIASVLRVKEIKIYSRNPENASRMASELRDKGFNAYSVGSYEEACKVDVIATVTNSREPFLRAEWIREGAHINLVGSNHPSRSEAFPEVFERASVVVTDSKEQAMIESGDLLAAVKANIISWDRVSELWEVVLGRISRRSWEEITIFKSHGIALWDLALANLIYRRAVGKGIGKEIQFKGYLESLSCC
ncbi:MAG TPA: ornithine cyclodeaminase family protein [Sulfolobales archaeon]|nr:ornithine cyclodeaminase family protein [Sulfolobales archaeon]